MQISCGVRVCVQASSERQLEPGQSHLISTGILILTELILRKEPHREHAEKNKLFLYKT